jgi:hypothetical protein
MTIKYYWDVEQGTDEWRDLKCGLLSASVMDDILPSAKGKERATRHSLMLKLAAERIAGFVEDGYESYNMRLGHEVEFEVRHRYTQNVAPVQQCGGITNDEWGFPIWYSPDGLVGDHGLIEVKGKLHKGVFETILAGVEPDEFKAQTQTALLVSGRRYCDLIVTPLHGGMPEIRIPVFPDPALQEVIIESATKFEADLRAMVERYQEAAEKKSAWLIPTERRIDDLELSA